MVDIHAHIIPAVDDGAHHLEEAVEMCKMAKKYGKNTIIATPHYKEGSGFSLTGAEILERVKALQTSLDEQDIKIQVLPGMELFVSPNLPEWLEAQKVLSLNHSKYILMELPRNEIPFYLEDLIFRLQVAGYVPIIAHPERNGKIAGNIKKLEKYVDRGALVQINKGSLQGEFGDKACKTAQSLIKSGGAHFIASDAHGTTTRNFEDKGIEQLVTRLVGAKNAQIMMQQNPSRLINNQEIIPINIDDFKRNTRRGTKVAAWILCLTLLVGGLGYVCLNTVFHMVFNSLISQTEYSPKEIDNILAGLRDNMPPEQSGETKPVEMPKTTTNQVVLDKSVEQKALVEARSLESGTSKKGNLNGQEKENITAKQQQKPSLSENESIESKVSTADKAKVIYMIYQSLTQDQINEIKAMSKDGFTPEELLKAKGILKSSLSQEQIGELKGLYYKYSK